MRNSFGATMTSSSPALPHLDTRPSRLTLSRVRASPTLSRQPSLERDYHSDASTVSSVFSTPHHARALSAASSFDSSPVAPDAADLPSKRAPGSSALPDLAEDPAELESGGDELPPSPVSPGSARLSRSSRDARRPSQTCSRRFDDYNPAMDDEILLSKRRRSAEQHWTGFADGVRSTLGSLSRRSRHLKRASTSSVLARTAFPPSPSPSPLVRSRAVSRAPSQRRSTERHLPEIPDESLLEGPRDDADDDSCHYHYNNSCCYGGDDRDRDRDRDDPHSLEAFGQYPISFDDVHLSLQQGEQPPRCTTPLLPRLLDDSRAAEPLQSPLQSPTVVDALPADAPSPLLCATPARTPEHRTPVASKKSSAASLSHGRAGAAAVPSSQIPPLFIADPDDEWAEELGHSNFTIHPQPYLPADFNRLTRPQFLADWERARSEYAVHRCRTAMTYGESSRTFRLTERKWASVDARWKAHNERFSRRVGDDPARAEPAPVASTARVEDPRFVKSEQIVGPMKVEPARGIAAPREAVTVSAPVSRKPSKRDSILRMFGTGRPGRAASHSRAGS